MGKYILESSRLIFSHLSEEDAPFVLRLLNDPDYIRYIGDRKVRTIQDARDYLLKGPLHSYVVNGYGLYLTSIKPGERTEQVDIGICGLLRRTFLPEADLGFALLPEFRGKGYALEAARAILQFAQDHFQLKTILAATSVDNEKSRHVLEKSGFLFEKTMVWPEDGKEVMVFRKRLHEESI